MLELGAVVALSQFYREKVAPKKPTTAGPSMRLYLETWASRDSAIRSARPPSALRASKAWCLALRHSPFGSVAIRQGVISFGAMGRCSARKRYLSTWSRPPSASDADQADQGPRNNGAPASSLDRGTVTRYGDAMPLAPGQQKQR